jgi:DNA-binding NarL/FixJ family response regulator
VIQVLVVDDHPVVRTGLAQLLEEAEDIALAGMAEDGQRALAIARAQQPDVVLMDLEMPGVDGIKATEVIREERPGTQVVVLTSFSDQERILDALDAGAIGYLLKGAEPDELLRGIRAAARGESPLAPKAASAVLAARSDRRPAEELTPRERDVLLMVAEGSPNKLIARRLDISERTVKGHLTHIFERIGVTDRTKRRYGPSATACAEPRRTGINRVVQERAAARRSSREASLTRGRCSPRPRSSSCASIKRQPSAVTRSGFRSARSVSIRAAGCCSAPARRSSATRLTVSSASRLLVPRIPVGPRLIQPTA